MTVIDLLSNPVVQDPAYHLFADGRTLLAIPNFWNVVSNLPFLVVGAIGFQVALEKKQELMSFVAIVIGEYLSVEWGKRLLVPLLIIGAGSVLYWVYMGDLRPYAIVQFLPILVVPVIVIVRRSHSDLGPYIAGMIALYVAAKIPEHYDAQFFAAGNLFSGHSLKHILSALAPACLLAGFWKRPHG
jgi:hypothetical protein